MRGTVSLLFSKGMNLSFRLYPSSIFSGSSEMPKPLSTKRKTEFSWEAWCTICGVNPALEQMAKKLSNRVGPHSLVNAIKAVSYTHLRAHETPEHLVCR